MAIETFLLTFREALEAALVVGIVLAYLEKRKATQYNRHVYLGVAAALVVSAFLALAFNTFFGGFEGDAEKIFEGITMLVAVVLLTWMIFWMMNQRHVAHEIRQKVEHRVVQKDAVGLFLFSFIAVLREGVETVIFVSAAAFVSQGDVLLWSAVGIAAAVIVGILVFETTIRLNVKTFFTVTSILLILFAAGLTAHALHEFQEVGFLPVLQAQAWNTKAVLNDKSPAGAVLRSLFGYNDDPTWLEVAGYAAYLAFATFAWKYFERKANEAKGAKD